MTEQADLYAYHSANYRSVADGLSTALALLHELVAQARDEEAVALARICTFLLTAKAEARLSKILHEPPVAESFRLAVLSGKPSLYEKWQRAVKRAFGEAHGVTGKFADSAASDEAKEQYRIAWEAIKAIDSVAVLRNSVAHGEWVHAFKSGKVEINEDKTAALASENAMTLMFKDRLVSAVGDAFHDLLVSHTTFERDLVHHTKRIEQFRTDLERRSWEKYAANLRNRHLRSQNARRAAVNKEPLPGS